MTTRARPVHWPLRVVAFLAAVVTVVVGLLGAGPASATPISTAQNAVGASTFAAPASVGASANITADQRLGEVGPGPGFVVATGVAANNVPARFIASSDGVVVDRVGSRNAISIGHYPEYVANAQTTGARTFSMADDAWNAMSRTERLVRNQRFLDDAISRGSEIQLATPLSQVRAGSLFEWEIGYLAGGGYVPNSSGTLMIPGGG